MLSSRAKQVRRSDMIALENSVSPPQYLAIMAIGVILLAKGLMNRLSPLQRTGLYIVTTLAGGWIIFEMLHLGFIGLALVIVFLLGVVINEIRHLG